jgi:hypothetical protein
MTRRSRYIILLIGFIAFLIGAPLIVLYIRGMSFDPETGKLVNTGILAVRSEPKDSAIYLDGDLKEEEEADIKFLRPKEYELVLRKPDYFDWRKRVSIKANEVTWAQGSTDKIHLLYPLRFWLPGQERSTCGMTGWCI